MPVLRIFMNRVMSSKVFGTALLAVILNLITTKGFAGAITGEVRFIDDPPKLANVRVSKDQDYCGETLPDDTYLLNAESALRNVVVFIESAPSKAPADAQKEHILNNTGCRYAPRILAMHKGEKLKVRNNDPKLHIPHSYRDERTVFNLSLPFKGTTIDATPRIRQPGILKVVCDTHAWMLAYIHVFDHPYFAVTDEHGTFFIPDIPAGTYVLTAWHEDVGTKSQEITIAEGGDVRVVLELSKK